MLRDGDKIRLAASEKEFLSSVAQQAVDPQTVADYNAWIDEAVQGLSENDPEQRLARAVLLGMRIEHQAPPACRARPDHAKVIAMESPEGDQAPLFIAAGDRIRFTSAGVEHFGDRFARCGIDIRRITTREQALTAMEASFPTHWAALVAQIADKKPANPRERVERDCLLAIALGDQDRAKGLQERIARLNAQEDARRDS